VPETTTQCSARLRWRYSESFSPGLIIRRLTWKCSPASTSS
jgi:hypothetical protein